MRGQADGATGAGGSDDLSGGPLVVGREHHPEGAKVALMVQVVIFHCGYPGGGWDSQRTAVGQVSRWEPSWP